MAASLPSESTIGIKLLIRDEQIVLSGLVDLVDGNTESVPAAPALFTPDTA